MKSWMARWLAPLLVIAGLLSVPVPWAEIPRVEAQETPSLVILDIEINGLRNISEGEIFTQLASRRGSNLDLQLVTRDIKSIYALGFFEDVRSEIEEIEGKGLVLRFLVRENPRVVALTFSGNTQISDKKVVEVLKLQLGGYYKKSDSAASLEAIRALYRAEGYLNVKLDVQVTHRDEFSYIIHIRIDESPRLYITDIRVVSKTKVFSELEIQRMMQSAEVDCFDWANDSGLFDEQKINQDLQTITSRYLRIGYVRVFIDKPKITLVHNREFSRIIVELDISEGEQYFTGTVDIQGDILGDKREVLDSFRIQPGEVFNALAQNQDLFTLRGIYLEQGYAFAQVTPEIKIKDETRTVDVIYRAVKNNKAYIGRIEFQGNRETRDFVMRREFEVRENELYNGTKLRLSQNNLTALGYFKPSLRIDTERREDDNILDVITKVDESQTGNLQATLGFSSQSGLTIGTSVSKGNFLGRGQTFRTTVNWSQKGVTRDISVDFIEPHLFDSEFSSDSSVGIRTIEDQSELERGTITEIRGSQGIGYRIIQPLRIVFSLSASNRTFDEVDEDAVYLRTFTSSLRYNTVNHPIFPSDGSSSTFSISQIGGEILGGTTEYRRYRIRSQRFFSLDEDHTVIVMGRARFGWLEKVGDNVIPPEDRFRLGGINSLRGYRFGEVGGPFGRLEQDRNAVTVLALDEFGNPILSSSGAPEYTKVDRRTLGLDEDTLAKLAGGGIFERLFNLELLFPLAGSNVRGVVFYDAGQINAEGEQYEILAEPEPEFFDLLQSVGVGIRVITPLGVMRFEYGTKLNKGERESPDEFDFTISTLF